jgi:heme/copper-type cytochrome/quinol oxidase subunit 2
MPFVPISKAALPWGAAFVFFGAAGGPAPTATPDRDATGPSLVISRRAFQPETIEARRGQTLRLRVVAADGEHCLAVDELRIEKRVLPGKPVWIELTPDRVGTFALYCCLDPDDARGRLVVSD